MKHLKMRSLIKKTTLTHVKKTMNRMMRRKKTGNMKTVFFIPVQEHV